MNADETYMSRCLELASNGLGKTAPNPMVGCVIVHHDTILGEGYHKKFGEAHAEVNAIGMAIEKHGEEILKHSHLYVSLEPCAHYGKTPPCADLIISKKIPQVTIGCIDPFAKVNGAGINKLQEAGIVVNVGILEKECREINRRFFTFHEKKRPYVILKWAQSMDGFIAPLNATEKNRKISNTYSHIHSHRWRSEEQAILVGANTVRTDNPMLTVREWNGKDPARIVIDPNDSIGNDAWVLGETSDVYVFSGQKKEIKNNIEWIKTDFSGNALQKIMDELYVRQIQSVVVEGGRITLQHFIDHQLWDEARIFTSTRFLNEGIKAPDIQLQNKIHEENILDDNLFIFRNS